MEGIAELPDGERDEILAYLLLMYQDMQAYISPDEEKDNVALVKRMVALNPALGRLEQDLLNAVYKKAISPRRETILELEHSHPATPENQQLVDQLIGTMRTELKDLARDLIDLVEGAILPATTLPEYQVWFHKMRGDWYRYLAEQKDGEFEHYKEQAAAAYREAKDLADTELKPEHPTRLGLMLNYSVFVYDILESREEALQLAEKTGEIVSGAMDDMPAVQGQEAAEILAVLQENVRQWKQFSENELA